MKLNFKDLKQQKFSIDAEPSDTIGDVKEKIAAEKGWDASSQKLIYSGKILADANTVESYKIGEKDFIVCMVSKPKAAPAPKPAPPSTPAVSTSTPAPPPAPVPNPATAPSNPPATPTPAQPPATNTTDPVGFNDPSAMLVGNRNESTVREMENMGFARPEIDRALRAAFFNPDRAIEYLLTGIPENIQAEQRQAPQAAANPATTAPAAAAAAAAAPAPPATAAHGDEPINLFEAAAQQGQGGARGAGARGGYGGGAGAGLGAVPGGGAGGGAGTGEQANIDFLRNNPQFLQLRQLVQQQPAVLEPLLQQVAEANPHLAQMIGQNQEAFLQLLSEDIGGEGIGGMGDTGPLPTGATPISVTLEERDAIERLCRLGFSRDQVIQAYFACDKNEELAANFLFDQPEDDEP